MCKKNRLDMEWLFYTLATGVDNLPEIGARVATSNVRKVSLLMLFAPFVTGIGYIVAYVVWRGKWLDMTMSLPIACLLGHGWELCSAICVGNRT